MPGSVPLLGKAEDATVFPHAIWHGPSPNRSGKARKTSTKAPFRTDPSRARSALNFGRVSALHQVQRWVIRVGLNVGHHFRSRAFRDTIWE